MKKLSDCTILIVDDTPMNIDVLLEAIGDDYDIIVATNGESAIDLAKANNPDLILLDVMMPGISGFDVLKILKSQPDTSSIPVILVTALSDISDKVTGFNLGAVDYLTKPFDIQEVKVRIKNHLILSLTQKELAEMNQILDQKVKERTEQLKRTQEVIIDTISSLVENRDLETGAHITRTKNYIMILLNALKNKGIYRDLLTDKYIEYMITSAPLHDIGKVSTPDAILNKPAKLTPEEFEIMKKHSEVGYNILKNAARRLGYESYLNVAAEMAHTHHERWDGKGYPRGLKENEIPLSGRVMALADVYDALISPRVYKPALSHDKVISIISQGKGTQFDPILTDVFLELHEEMRDIAIRYTDDV